MLQEFTQNVTRIHLLRVSVEPAIYSFALFVNVAVAVEVGIIGKCAPGPEYNHTNTLQNLEAES